MSVMIKNGIMEVPARIYQRDLTELEMKTIEMSENFFRKDLEYWEYDNIVREIHRLQQELHGERLAGTRTDLGAEKPSGWGMQDTGELMGISKMSVSNAVKRAEAREVFPELFDSCKTQKDASKVLDRVQEAAVRDAIAKKIEAQKLNGSLGRLSKSFILGSFFDGVQSIPDGSINFIEIDPPYAIDLRNIKKANGGVSKYDLSEYNEIPQDIFMTGAADHQWKGLFKVFQECYRVMADHSWLICWFAPEPWFQLIYKGLNAVGFETTRMVGIWTKGGGGQNNNPASRLTNTYEMFFYAWKGKPALSKAGRSNEFRVAPVPAAQKVHPTERPVELMKEIYETFAFQGSRILIPFLGSGNGLFAAEEVGMSALGFELGKAYKDSFLVRAHHKYGV